MLKIRDNVDLKELEKFGFKPKYDEDTGNIIAYKKVVTKTFSTGILIKKTEYKKTKIRIYKNVFKKIWVIDNYGDFYDLDTLYDLIKAGLVEKIND